MPREIKNQIDSDDVYWEMDWSGTNSDGTRKYPNKPEKEMMFEEDMALAHLLMNNEILLNNKWWEKDLPEKERESIYVAIICNDMFAWGCADAEELPYNQIKPCYELFKKDPMWGTTVWCMIRRKELPQSPVAKDMIAAGWDLDALAKEHGLKPNYYDGVCGVQARMKYRTYVDWAKAQGKEILEFVAGWWKGWEAYTKDNPNWYNDEWKAAERAEIDQWAAEAGWNDGES